MKESFLFKNTDSAKSTANLDTNSSSIFTKKKQNNFHAIISFLSLLLLFFLGNKINAQTSIVFTSNSTWTCPANVTEITVEAWGAGAGGRVGGATKGYTGAGGGGGAYARLNTVSVTPGTSYTLTVGGISGYDTAGSASTATFGSNTIKAAGGSIGAVPGTNAAGGAGGTVALSIGDVRFAGGNGGNSYGFTSASGGGSGGGGGGGAGSTGPGNNGLAPTSYSTGGTGGALVNNFGGAGGKGGNDDSYGLDASATGYGGGGGGAGNKTGNGFAWIGGSGQHGAIIITLILPNGPGGVTQNLHLWLRSDLLDGTTNVADNSPVTSWQTQALGDNAAKPAATGSPIYKNNPIANINFNSVVDFTNNNITTTNNYNDTDPTRQYLRGPTGFYSQDIFVVMIPDVPVTSTLARMAIFCGDQNSTLSEADITGLGYGNYTARMNNEVLTYALGTSSGVGFGYGVAHQSTTASYSSAGIINSRNNAGSTAEELYFNANNVANSTSDPTKFANVSNSQYWIGRSEGIDGTLDGRVAEVITYSSRTTDTQRSNIRSYLAIKYGITLGVSGTSMNYTNSAGTTIWDSAANNTYNYDIAGIGRDDITKLTQKQSKSINTTDDITIGLGDIYTTNTANINTFDTDKKFLVWGNNLGALTAQSIYVNISSGITPALVTDVSYQTINRKWKLVETGGDVPSCKVSIPVSMLAATNTPALTPGDYLMFISNTSTFDATAEARIMTVNGSNLETTYNFDGTKYITFGFAPEKTFERCIQFDGTNDYLDSGNVLNLTNSFTVSAWVNSNRANQTILSKRNSAFTQGYDLCINSDGKAQMSWIVSGVEKKIISSAVIPLNIWHHIGVTFDGTTAKIYVDGVNKISESIGVPTATTNSFLIAAANGSVPTSFFKGSIDEVRVWDVALTDTQFRYVMNQEILSNATLTNGAIIPNTIALNDISSLPWTNLKAYYPMSAYSFINAKDKSSYGLTAALRNINTVDLQTAPLPYESTSTGNWEAPGTWKNYTLQELPYSDSIENPPTAGSSNPPPPIGLISPVTIEWNIIKIKNSYTVTSVGNKKVLGLFIEPTANLIATTSGGLQTDGTKIEVSHYLKLDGKIDLVGRSQLVQTEDSDLDITSSGSIERDQQGQANKFNYNYWSSPVGAINATTNNNTFTVGDVLRDGTNPASPVAINWVSGYNGSPGSPISLAGYWIYKFDNLANDYANWTQIFQTGSLQAGKGFTLKGSDAATTTQNLTFTGKPNNGTITNTVSKDQLLLIGNPYPSALDADQFITDNIASLDVTTTNPSIDGALYFWEHYSTNSTHNLGGYQGGYAIRNLAGGVAPSSTGVDFISGSGTTSKTVPKRYIPVGQGFFVFGNSTGGDVKFKNSQRAFFKEDNAASQTTYRIPVPKGIDHWNDNSDDQIAKDTYKRIRLGYNSYNETFHRQVLLAFMDEKANSEMNAGYDAYNIDDSPSDMYLLNGENELAIQGEGYFNEYASYPIGVRLETAGKVSFGIDGLENFDDTQNFFIYDKLDDSYHNIKATLYEVELPEGSNNDRFALRFTDKTLGTDTVNLSRSDEAIVIVNQNVTVQSSGQLIKDITVYDLSGRKIDSYKKVNVQKYMLNHLNKTTAGLILKITLDNDTVVTKKIIY